jgi:hypothetical protein
MPVYAATIFLSAFLLFQVQPLIAKFALPWFGGSAAVWSTVLLFFQLLLLAGYLYAHILIKYVAPRLQFWVHAALLIVAMATLPIIPSPALKPMGGVDPTFQILKMLALTVGLPYTLLASTSPLLQAWFVRTHTGAVPYRLFALSNLGSMLALLSYPSLVEPFLRLGMQAWVWSAGFGLFAIACGYAGWKSSAGSIAKPASEELPAPGPRVGDVLLWIGLAACASTLLLSVTSHLTQNVAPIPLLWVVPLSLYLLSFILCFERDAIYNRWVFLPLFVIALGLFAYGNYLFENNGDVVKKLIPAMCGALFICCMVCHGELARSRPHPRHLTLFYLMVSVGGAVGGLFVALVAPRVFNTYLEFPVALVASAVLVAIVLLRQMSALAWSIPQRIALATPMVLAIGGFAGYLAYREHQTLSNYIFTARNFYGVLHVKEDPPAEDYPGERVLIHGTINHGTEVKLPNAGRIPTSYFGEGSGIALAVRALHDRGPLRIGILGLGAGVTATLAEAGDTLHYYEINSLVVDIAKTKFDFWEACPADKRLFMGDGRLTLEAMSAPENLDFLAMDAFTSDAVPVHLITKEAYRMYLGHLKKNGVMAINISNRYLNLEPVVAQAAAELGLSGVVVPDEGDGQSYYTASTWVLMSPDASFFKHKNFRGSQVAQLVPKPDFRPWTDDYSNIIRILK